MDIRTSWIAALLVLLSVGSATRTHAQDAAADKLARAIAVLRHVDQKAIKKDRIHAKAVAIQSAWETIFAAGTKGREALKAELKKIEDARERDDFFKLGAAALLWTLGHFDEAPTIAAIWETTPVEVQYTYTFHTAFDAARTRDKRALPMLLAVSKDKNGVLFIPMHSWNIAWPLTAEFLWGVYGPAAIPTLKEVLQTSKSAPQIETAMFILAQMQESSALPKIRAMARTRRGSVAAAAYSALGRYGHPDDYAVLVKALSSKNDDEVAAAAGALGYFGDQRAVPRLIPLLKSKHERTREEAAMSLYDLLTPESLTALREYYRQPGVDRGELDELAGALSAVGSGWEAWEKASDADKEAIVAKIRGLRTPDLVLKPEDRRLTHEQFLQVLDEWKRNGRRGRGTYSWVEPKHVLAVATPEDVPRLLETRARFYERLSDECMYDVRFIDFVLQRLGRGRYRKDPGVCAKVEPK